MSNEDALYWAGRVLDPYSVCAICSVPSRMLWAYTRLRYPYLGNVGGVLNLDHIVPGAPATRDNIRLLCGKCNTTRGAGIFADTEVFVRVTKWWRSRLTAKELWWIGSAPGVPGVGRMGTKHAFPGCTALEEHASDAQVPAGPPPPV